MTTVALSLQNIYDVSNSDIFCDLKSSSLCYIWHISLWSWLYDLSERTCCSRWRCRQQSWTTMEWASGSRLQSPASLLFLFFPGMQRAEQVNRNRSRKIWCYYLKRDLRKVKKVTLNSHKLGFRPNIVNPACQLNSEAIKLRISFDKNNFAKSWKCRKYLSFYSKSCKIHLLFFPKFEKIWNI